MENIYTFNINDTLSQEFIDKLNNNYLIKKITMTLKNVIDKSFENNCVVVFNYINKNNIEEYRLDIINISQYYYNNIITFNCNPIPFSFYDNLKCISCNSTLNFFENNKNEAKHIDIIKYEIELIKNTREYDIYCSFNIFKCDTFTISTDCFDNYDELKKYFIEMSDTSSEIFDKWIQSIIAIFSATQIIIYKNNYSNYHIIYENKCKYNMITFN